MDRARTQGSAFNARKTLRRVILKARRFLEDGIWGILGQPEIAFLWFETKNWGDALNPVLISKIAGKRVKGIDIRDQYSPSYTARYGAVYLVVGSTLAYADSNTVVWGPGLIAADRTMLAPPRRICAVRGPLTRAALLRSGVTCPDVYGDPALLYPFLYRPVMEKSCKLGLVPHYVDRNHPFMKNMRREGDIALINIKGPINKVVDSICKCEYVASSSLHGLILATAYRIPCAWLVLGDRVSGGEFKFRDFFASVRNDSVVPVIVRRRMKPQDIIRSCVAVDPKVDLERLLDACPFRRDDLNSLGDLKHL